LPAEPFFQAGAAEGVEAIEQGEGLEEKLCAYLYGTSRLAGCLENERFGVRAAALCHCALEWSKPAGSNSYRPPNLLIVPGPLK
jgi:hypothetical protein